MKKLLFSVFAIAALSLGMISCDDSNKKPEVKAHDTFPSWEQNEANAKDSCLNAQAPSACTNTPCSPSCDNCTPCDTCTPCNNK